MYELFTAVFAFLFTVACLYSLFPKRILRWPLFWGVISIHGRHSERYLLFSVLALYCMTLNFGHVGVGRIFDLFNSPLVASWFSLCFQFLLCDAA